MAIIQEIKDGKFVQDTTEEQKKKKTVNNEMGQEQFLQLLVAQMQYQDPLEPTSNTEWVAQMATFSMVESLNTMQKSMTEQSANGLVGKYVLINTGNGYEKGRVDYVTKKNGETVLSVNDKLYTLDKLDTIADEEYYQGSVLANELQQMIKLLPGEENLTVKDEGLLKSAREAYEKMTDSQKLFVEKEDLDKLRTLETKMDALKATHYTGLVRDLPSVSEIEAADEQTLAAYSKKLTEISEFYETMTDTQKKNISENTANRLKQVEAAVEEASKKFQTDQPSDEEPDVADLLQQILNELKGQKQPDADNTESN